MSGSLGPATLVFGPLLGLLGTVTGIISTFDVIPLFGSGDPKRVMTSPDWIPASLAGLSEVVAEGVPVLGYTHWTLLDNYEWVFGYESKLGLCEVDRVTFDRTPKPSAAVYAGLVAASRA